MFLVFSFFLPGELCQSRCFFSIMIQSTFSKGTIPCVFGNRNLHSNYMPMSFSAPHCLSVPSLQSIAPQTLPSHTWNVGVRNKCFKNTRVPMLSLQNAKSLNRPFADGWRHVPTRLQMGLQAHPMQLWSSLLRWDAQLQSVVSHAILPNGLMSLSTILQWYSPNVYLNQSLHHKTLAWYLQFHHTHSPEEHETGSLTSR